MTQEERASLRALADTAIHVGGEFAFTDEPALRMFISILDALDRAEADKAEAVKAERERCAKVIEENTIWWSKVNGPYLARRVQGDVAGLYYATEIRKEPT